MPQLVLNRGTSYRQSYFRKFLPKIELGPVFLLTSLVLFVALVTVITLVFSTRQVTKGYALNELEATHQKLVKANEVNDMKISTVRSLNYLEQSSKIKRMVRPRDIVFINSDTAIASR